VALGCREDVRMKLWAAGVRVAFAGGLITLSVDWAPASVVAAAAGPSTAIYVTDSGSDTLSVVSAATDMVVATVPVGQKPWAVAVSADGMTAYVSNSGSDDVSVVDMRTRKVRATVVVGVRPCDLLLSPDGRFLYADVFTENAVAVIDTHSDAVVAKIPVGGTNPYGMAMSPSGDTIYTANVDESNNAASTVSVIDTRTRSLTKAIGGFNGSEGVAASPDGRTVYATSITANLLSVIDAQTNLVTRSVTAGNGPQGVGVPPNGSAIYVANSAADNVSVVDPPSLSVARTVQVGTTPDEIAFSADSAHAYVSAFSSASISDISTTTGTVLATVNVGSQPHGIAVGRLVPLGSVASSSRVSSIAGSLPRPSDAFSSGTTVVVSAVVAVAGTFFLTFPAHLFNLTLHENYDTIRAWWLGLPNRFRRKRKGAVSRPDADGLADPEAARAAAATAQATGSPVQADTSAVAASPSEPEHEGVAASSSEPEHGGVAASSSEPEHAGVAASPSAPTSETTRGRERLRFALVVLVGALFGALLDPRFGANARTAESYIAIVATVVLGTLLPALVTAAYHRAGTGHAPYHLEALPGGLLIAAGCVLVSRVAGFQPGYLYGVVAGIAFTRSLAKKQKGHVVALSTVTTLTVAVVAWFAWVPVDRIAEKPGAFAGLVIADDFLGSMFVGGLVGTVIGLVPLEFLPGWTLRQWHRGVWAGLFALASFGVVDFLLLHHHHHASNGGSIVTTVVLFVLFAGGSVVFREHFVRKRRAATGSTPRGWHAKYRELMSPAPAVAAATARPEREPSASDPAVSASDPAAPASDPAVSASDPAVSASNPAASASDPAAL
jgi:YVTN family beta-propeller protein